MRSPCCTSTAERRVAVDNGIHSRRAIARVSRAIFWAALLAVRPIQGHETDGKPPAYPAEKQFRPTPIPDRIVLTWSGDPARSVDVTWRTDAATRRSALEYKRADQLLGDLRSGDVPGCDRIHSVGEEFRSDLGVCTIHSLQMNELEPSTRYVYRVGDGVNWSEWFQFRTASDRREPFSFVYFGDAQNAVRSLWSRVIREAHQQAPRAAFMLHAGDLINSAAKDGEWGEWFAAGGWLNGMIPTVATPGNHEYSGEEDQRRLTKHWTPQFAFPRNGPAGLDETAYWFDYQGVRFVSLNSNERIDEQAAWFERLCQDHPAPHWHIATFHHPIYSATKDRDNRGLREAWKPLFDKYGVDLALQGHDHTYARSALGGPENASSGANVQAGDTVYVVSVSGPKMYSLGDTWPAERMASGAQLYQVIHIDGDVLNYEARLATGELYDAFTLKRNGDGRNELTNRIPNTPEINAVIDEPE
ncbi:MAG: metallophosphoesterase family protein [Planctomycetota bacterium]